MLSVLDNISSPSDLQNLTDAELAELCSEIRIFLTENIARSGGHLASNLGVVELTVALHRVYDTARDRVVFDVGHQSYVHKILTGRRDGFDKLRSLGGISGFPMPSESPHDAFIAGHASNSISVALGMARARTVMGGDYHVAAIVGDGALTGGLAFEGLSNAGVSGEPLLVILNDNGMSINRNVGSIARLLMRMRVRPGYFDFKRAYRSSVGKMPALYGVFHAIKEKVKSLLLDEGFFEEFGFYYLGPVDGTDLKMTEAAMRWARELKRPVLLHVKTQKGKGIGFAEKSPDLYHGVGAFDVQTGGIGDAKMDFSAVFGEELLKFAKRDERICALTAAMENSTGLARFANEFPRRFFDVGIAEGHAVSMAAGMATGGAIPVFAVYSSFLQRAYDMLIHDTAIMNLHVVLGVDRAGIVGQDGITHQGVFDVSFLSSVPNMKIYAPASFAELRDMMEQAVFRDAGPVAIRYPRGSESGYIDGWKGENSAVLRDGSDITIVSYGIIINEAVEAAGLLAERGISVEVIKLNVINPQEAAPVIESVRKTGALLVAEDVIEVGGIGERLLAAVEIAGIEPCRAGLANLGSGIIPHGRIPELLGIEGVDAEGIYKKSLEILGKI